MKQKLITDYYTCSKKNKLNIEFDNNIFDNNIFDKKIYGYNLITNSFHCLSCGIDMGIENPRQLCNKTWCSNMYN